MKPLVAIILVNYNGYEDTIECIKSLQKISYDNYRIIVVNNGSTIKASKDQLIFLKEHTDYIDYPDNVGFSGGNNIGMRYAEQKFSPKYFLLLNNDTVVKEDFLDILVENAELRSGAGIVCGKIYFYSEPDRIWFAGAKTDFNTCNHSHYKCTYREVDRDFSDRVEEIDFATGCLWLLSVNAVKKIGYMDEDFFLYCEDDEYCLRMIANGFKILYCNRAIIYHKISASTGNKSFLQQYYIARNHLYIIKRYAKKKGMARRQQYFRWCKDIIRGRKNFRPIFRAILDYKRNRMGRMKDV